MGRTLIYKNDNERVKAFRQKQREKLKKEIYVKQGILHYLKDAECFELETLNKLGINGRWDSKVEYTKDQMYTNYKHALKAEDFEFNQSYISFNLLSRKFLYFCPHIRHDSLCDELVYEWEERCPFCNGAKPSNPEDLIRL